MKFNSGALTVIPGMNKSVENMLVSNHKNLTSRWMELSRIASGVKKHNAYLEALRERSRDYATILQSSSQSAINMRSRVRGVLSAIEGLEAALITRDTTRVSAYLRLLNEVLASGARDSEAIAQRQELLMKNFLNDAELIAKGAKQAHAKSSLFAVSAVGALAAGVVLTVRLIIRRNSIPTHAFLTLILATGRSWPFGKWHHCYSHSNRKWRNADRHYNGCFT